MQRAPLIGLAGILGLSGCCGGGGRAKVAAPRGPEPPLPSLLAQAEAYERGDGVARDYARAAAIYGQLCDGGKGDVEACRRLIEAIGEARGTSRDVARILELTTAVCLEAGDPVACVYATLLIPWRPEFPRTPRHAALERKLEEIDAEHFEERCEAGDARACEAHLEIAAMALQSGDDDVHTVMCAADRIDGCIRLVSDYSECEDENCVARTIADWTAADHRPPLDALARLERWCTAGDARACKVLPGRAIDPAALCAAKDYEACALVGCAGDPDSLARARMKGVTDECDDLTRRAAYDAAAPALARGPKLVADPPLPPITPSDRLPFDSLHFRQLAIRDETGWPRFEVHNLGKRKVVRVWGLFYAHDAQGNQVARTWSGPVLARELAPGASATVKPNAWLDEAIPREGLTFEVCYDAIQFARDSARYQTRCPARKKRGERWGDGNARQVLNVMPLWPLLNGHRVKPQDPYALDERHAAAFEAIDPTVMIDVWGQPERRGLDRPYDITASVGLKAEEHTVRVPISVTPVAVAYRLDGFDGVRLSPATLAKIFRGDIKRWDDPAIARDNPGVVLPPVDVLVLIQSSRGDEDPFIRYLKQPPATHWPANGARWELPARAAQVKEQDGTISHLDLFAARAQGLQVARIQNRAGVFVEPSATAATAAVASATIAPDLSFDPLDAPGRDAYPIVYATWAVVSLPTTDTATWPLITRYLTYLLTDAQPTLAQDHLGALPPPLAARAVAAVAAMPSQ